MHEHLLPYQALFKNMIISELLSIRKFKHIIRSLALQGRLYYRIYSYSITKYFAQWYKAEPLDTDFVAPHLKAQVLPNMLLGRKVSVMCAVFE